MYTTRSHLPGGRPRPTSSSLATPLATTSSFFVVVALRARTAVVSILILHHLQSSTSMHHSPSSWHQSSHPHAWPCLSLERFMCPYTRSQLTSNKNNTINHRILLPLRHDQRSSIRHQCDYNRSGMAASTTHAPPPSTQYQNKLF